jgi:hypothetical protein
MDKVVDYTEKFLKVREADGGTCFIEKVSARGGTLRIGVRYGAEGTPRQTPAGLVVAYDHKTVADASAWLIPAADGPQRPVMYFDLPACSIPFKQTHWSLFMLLRSDQGEIIIPVKTRETKGAAYRMRAMLHRPIRRGDDILFVRNKGDHRAGLILRKREEYDSGGFIAKELLALALYLLTRRKLRKERILLIHEKKNARASDNAYYLFLHAMNTDAGRRYHRKIYYVIDKKAPDYDKVKRWDAHVVDNLSVRHMIALLGCRAIASTESRIHDYVWFPRFSFIMKRSRKKKHIFLQHGVLAIKRLPDGFKAGALRSSLVCCISESEAAIMRDWLGFPDDRIEVTGYARFDVLEDKSGESREIAMMPSIRTTIFWAGEAEFMNDPYYKMYASILNDPELHNILEERSYTLNFFLHPSITRFERLFTSASPRIRIVKEGETPLDEVMMRAKALITDYSSVAWDMYYMDKPLLFFQYDSEDFLATSGSYIDLKADLPGERTEDKDELIKMIGRYAADDFRMPAEYEAKRRGYFKYFDGNSAERILEAIRKHGL